MLWQASPTFESAGLEHSELLALSKEGKHRSIWTLMITSTTKSKEQIPMISVYMAVLTSLRPKPPYAASPMSSYPTADPGFCCRKATSWQHSTRIFPATNPEPAETPPQEILPLPHGMPSRTQNLKQQGQYGREFFGRTGYLWQIGGAVTMLGVSKLGVEGEDTLAAYQNLSQAAQQVTAMYAVSN